jgi:putative membrane-bound dehydrogenase-like protein
MVAIVTGVAGSLQAMLCLFHSVPTLLAMLFALAGFAPEARSAAQVEVDGRLRVLFLGDRGHHQPEARLHQVYGELGRARIAVDYEEKVEALTPERLALYDVLMVYANHLEIAPENESALAGWVHGGGGLFAVHCASACFPDSSMWGRLVGARFASHGGEVFTQTVVDATHPVTSDWQAFTSWDETYVHSEHQSNQRQVLTTRDGEPWMWVRKQGAGRVIYTASGHDERTWSQPAFVEVLKRGIVWAAGDDAAATWRAAGELPALSYRDEGTVPNYERRDPKPQYQLPLDPAAAQQHMQAAAGFRIELFACEPDITNPIAMCWDELGRLWVLESTDYPNQVNADGVGRDKITVCEDTDGDGQADKFTTFAEGLNIPTAITRWGKGVIIAQAPDVIYLADEDGDGSADARKTLFSGFGRGDTHAGPSSFSFGPDGWIYGAVGYSAFDGEVGGERVRLTMGVYRFKPDGSKLEPVGRFTNNTWGFGFNPEGELFGSTANGAPSFHIGLPQHQLRALDPQATGAALIMGFSRLHHLSPYLRQVDVFGGYTAAAGHNFTASATLPPHIPANTALICEPTGHLVSMAEAVPVGSSYRTEGGWNLVASSEEWFSPVQAEVGPDGAVWIADWCEFIVQHNPTPNPRSGGFQAETGPGNAHVNPLRDRERGRIWRIVPTVSAEAEPAPQLGGAAPAEWIAALDHPNRFWRMQAQRLLTQLSPSRYSAAMLEAWPSTSDRQRVHLIPLMFRSAAAMRSSEEGPLAGLRASDPAIVRATLRELPASEASSDLLKASNLLFAPDAGLRRAAWLAAARMPESRELGKFLGVAAVLPDLKDDPFLLDALALAGMQHAPGFLEGLMPLLERDRVLEGEAAPNLFANPNMEAGRIEGQQTERGFQPANWRVRTYSGSAQHHWSEGGRGSGMCLKIQSTDGADSSWYQDVAVQPRTRYRLSAWIRTEGLASLRNGMGALLNVHTMGQTVTAAVRGDSDWQRVEVEFETGAGQRSVSINCLFGGWGWASGTAYYDDLSLTEIRGGSLAADLARRVGEARGRDAGARRASMLQAGDAAQGEEVFRNNPTASCLRCHRLAGEGGLIGPALDGVGTRLTPDQLLDSLLDPNATLAEGFAGGVSPMPPMGGVLADEDIRHLVAYLSSLNKGEGEK